MSEEDNSLEVFRRRCLEAVLMNDEHQVEQLCQCLVDIKGPNSLISLLMDTQHFPPLGQGHGPALLRALKDLMDAPLPPSPNHITHPASILENYSRAYRGLIIHLAAALGRTGIVCKLIDMAKRYQLDCTKQLTVTDVNYNTALCLAVQNYHNETIQAILDLLQQYPSSSTEFLLRHCAAKTSRRLVYCTGSKLGSFFFFKRQSEKMGYDLFSCMSVLFLIWCRDGGSIQNFVRNYGMSYCSSILDLNPFYYAAFLYSQRAMTDVETCILHILKGYRCTFTCEYSKWDSVHVLKIGNNMVFNGTAAHFAISSYQLSELALHKKFPDIQQASDSVNRKRGDENHPSMQGIQKEIDLAGPQGNEDEYQPPKKKRKVNGGHPPTQGTEEDEDEASWQGGEAGDDNPIFEMLRFLHGDFGINLFQVNWEGKTPLECLPPDADPALVNRLIDYLHYEYSTDTYDEIPSTTDDDNDDDFDDNIDENKHDDMS